MSNRLFGHLASSRKYFFVWLVLVIYLFSGAASAQLSSDQKTIHNKGIPRFDLCGEESGGDDSAEEDIGAPTGDNEYIQVGDIPKSGKTVGASIYGGSYTGGKWKASNGQQGGGGDDTGIGNHDNPLPGTTSYAELSHNGGSDYSAMGNLPNGTKLEIKYNGKVIIAEKADVGAGGSDVKGKPRAIDLWWEVVKFIDPEGKTDLSNGVDTLEIHAVPKSTKVTKLTGAAEASSGGDQVSGSPCCSEGDNQDASLSGSNNIAKAINFFVSEGFSQHQAAGIVGNFMQESGVNPKRVEDGWGYPREMKSVPPNKGPDGQPGYGIAQWTSPGRKTGLKNFAKDKKMKVYSLKLQLMWVMEEMKGYGSLEQDLKKIDGSNRDTIEQSAVLFHQIYEVSADSAEQIQERVDSGVQALEQNGGSVSAGSGGASASEEDGSSAECGQLGSGNSTGEMVWPVDGPVTSCYGVLPSRGRLHTGLDIAAPVGSKVVAADGGEVIEAGNIDPAGFGNTIIIKHSGGEFTLYAHLSSFSVHKGDKVDQGQKIAESGGAIGAPGAGSSRGPHLHFNVQTAGTSAANESNTKNPLDFLPNDGRQMTTSSDGKCVPGDKGFK